MTAKKTKLLEKDNNPITLESEISQFVKSLPIWAYYLANKILNGTSINNIDIEVSYNFLLDELNIPHNFKKPNLEKSKDLPSEKITNEKVYLSKIENIRGVNLLSKYEKLEFSPNLTIIYGANGTGKSSYTRLFKKVFYSKAVEDILPNIYNDDDREIKSKFTFKTDHSSSDFSLEQRDHHYFKQFSVFDGKSQTKQLSEKNEFEFRPAGLSFFSTLTKEIQKLEEKVHKEITQKKNEKSFQDYILLFEGDSEIKKSILEINSTQGLSKVNKFLPFSDLSKSNLNKLLTQVEDLNHTIKNIDNQKESISELLFLVSKNKKSIERLNTFFSKEKLKSVSKIINKYISDDLKSRKDGAKRFESNLIKGIGSTEWSEFISATYKFAQLQATNTDEYPKNGDNCLLCHQPLSNNAEDLLSNYWKYILSVNENEIVQSQKKIEEQIHQYETLNFNYLEQENILGKWLKETHPNKLKLILSTLLKMKDLCEEIKIDINNKRDVKRLEIQLDLQLFEDLEKELNTSNNLLVKENLITERDILNSSITLLTHNEQLSQHYESLKLIFNNTIWIEKFENVDFLKRKITDSEKQLSSKYFNKDYITSFNEECEKLNGNFGIEISHSGAAGKSFRQLKLKGNYPNSILSEGEQKVIALADFIAEMNLSAVNNGLIFDDPVTSLDHERKETIAKRVVEESKNKQIIIFTHDIVFIKALENCCKEIDCDNKIAYHKIVSNWPESCGIVELNTSPLKDKQYTDTSIPRKFQSEAIKSKDRSFSQNLIRSGFGALRSCYEAVVVSKVLAGTVQRYDPLVRVPNIKKIKFDYDLYKLITLNHSRLHDLIEGHLPLDELNQNLTAEKLKRSIEELDEIIIKIENL